MRDDSWIGWYRDQTEPEEFIPESVTADRIFRTLRELYVLTGGRPNVVIKDNPSEMKQAEGQQTTYNVDQLEAKDA